MVMPSTGTPDSYASSQACQLPPWAWSPNRFLAPWRPDKYSLSLLVTPLRFCELGLACTLGPFDMPSASLFVNVRRAAGGLSPAQECQYGYLIFDQILQQLGARCS